MVRIISLERIICYYNSINERTTVLYKICNSTFNIFDRGIIVIHASRDDENTPFHSILTHHFAICLSGYLACLS